MMFTLNRKRMLLSDDNVDEQALVREIIIQLDKTLRVETVSNGHQLLRYLAKCKTAGLPNLVILDIKTPYLKELEVLERIQSENPGSNVPIVVWSTFFDENIEGRCLVRGAAGCFPKPTLPSEMKLVARQMLEFCQ
jgi:CheY-like chemotaxis protein